MKMLTHETRPHLPPSRLCPPPLAAAASPSVASQDSPSALRARQAVLGRLWFRRTIVCICRFKLLRSLKGRRDPQLNSASHSENGRFRQAMLHILRGGGPSVRNTHTSGPLSSYSRGTAPPPLPPVSGTSSPHLSVNKLSHKVATLFK